MIERIEIHHYKSIRDLTINLKPINVIIGSNGVGKSNFISFFEFILKIYNKQLNSYIIQKGGVDNFLYGGRKVSDSFGGLIDFDNRNALGFNIKPTPTDRAFIDWLYDIFNKDAETAKQYNTWHQQIWDNAVEESALQDSPTWRAEHLKRYLTSCKVYHFHDTGDNSFIKRKSKIDDNRFLREDGSNLAAFLYRLQLNYPQDFARIEATIRSVAPFFQRFDLNPSANNEEDIRLEWKEKDSDMYLNAHNLSDGTLRFIALVTLLMQPELPATIIIDEPELGLHPFAINKLAALIQYAATKGAQVIVSTQSVNLLNNFNADDIIVADRKDRQTSFKRLDSVELGRWLEEYTLGDMWEKNMIGGQP